MEKADLCSFFSLLASGSCIWTATATSLWVPGLSWKQSSVRIVLQHVRVFQGPVHSAFVHPHWVGDVA